MSLTCSCGVIFKHRQSLLRHRKSAHPAPPGSKSDSTRAPSAPSLVCGVCSGPAKNAKSKSDFKHHLAAVHDVRVTKETVRFDTVDDFHDWKIQMERETRAAYTKVRGTVCSKDSQRMMFVCNRSGRYASRGEGIRRLKIQGSRKIGAYCPSEMNLKIEKDGRCTVDFIRTHWGHQRELAHLSLTGAERAAIARKIAANVPLDDILHDVRKDISDPSKLKRVELLTKKDLYNISACFNFHPEYMEPRSAALSVDAGRKGMREQEEEPESSDGLPQNELTTDYEDSSVGENEISLNEICNGQMKNDDTELLRIKKETIELLKNIIVAVQNSTSIDEIMAVKNLITKAASIMAAVRESSADPEIQFIVRIQKKEH